MLKYFFVLKAYLNHEEFSEPERNDKIGTDLWPFWHHGVLSMYGASMSLNHFAGSNQLNIIPLKNLIDHSSASMEEVSSKILIHTYQTYETFSKYSFKEGKYDHMKINDNQAKFIKFYCLKNALESKNMTNFQLRNLFNNQSSNKLNT